MANNNKTKRFDGDDAPTYQFTSYQLVMMICAALLLMVLVFMAGSFVQGLNGPGKQAVQESEASTTGQDKAEVQKKSETPKTANAGAATTKRQEGVQISPKRVTIPEGSGTSSKSPEIKTARDAGAAYIPAPPPSRPTNPVPPAPPAAQGKTTVTDIPPPAKDKTPAAPAQPEKAVDPATTAKQTQTAPAPATPAPAPSAPAPAPDAATGKVPAEKPAAPEKMQTAQAPPKAETAAPAPKGGYTVQVASFEVAKKAAVEEYVKRIKSNSDFDVRVIPSGDGSRLRVCIGQYADKKDADKARDELRAVKEFKGCWVLALNE